MRTVPFHTFGVWWPLLFFLTRRSLRLSRFSSYILYTLPPTCHSVAAISSRVIAKFCCCLTTAWSISCAVLMICCHLHLLEIQLVHCRHPHLQCCVHIVLVSTVIVCVSVSVTVQGTCRLHCLLRGSCDCVRLEEASRVAWFANRFASAELKDRRALQLRWRQLQRCHRII